MVGHEREREGARERRRKREGMAARGRAQPREGGWGYKREGGGVRGRVGVRRECEGALYVL